MSDCIIPCLHQYNEYRSLQQEMESSNCKLFMIKINFSTILDEFSNRHYDNESAHTCIHVFYILYILCTFNLVPYELLNEQISLLKWVLGSQVFMVTLYLNLLSNCAILKGFKYERWNFNRTIPVILMWLSLKRIFAWKQTNV